MLILFNVSRIPFVGLESLDCVDTVHMNTLLSILPLSFSLERLGEHISEVGKKKSEVTEKSELYLHVCPFEIYNRSTTVLMKQGERERERGKKREKSTEFVNECE